eukprot:tig00001704_g9579.t1
MGGGASKKAQAQAQHQAAARPTAAAGARPQSRAGRGAPSPMPARPTSTTPGPDSIRRRVIFETGSMGLDDIFALFYLVNNPLIDLRLVVLTEPAAAEASDLTVGLVQRLLCFLKRPSIPVAVGSNAPLAGDAPGGAPAEAEPSVQTLRDGTASIEELKRLYGSLPRSKDAARVAAGRKAVAEAYVQALLAPGQASLLIVKARPAPPRPAPPRPAHQGVRLNGAGGAQAPTSNVRAAVQRDGTCRSRIERLFNVTCRTRVPITGGLRQALRQHADTPDAFFLWDLLQNTFAVREGASFHATLCAVSILHPDILSVQAPRPQHGDAFGTPRPAPESDPVAPAGAGSPGGGGAAAGLRRRLRRRPRPRVRRPHRRRPRRRPRRPAAALPAALRRPVIFDCGCGVEDVAALLYAAQCPKLDLRAVVTHGAGPLSGKVNAVRLLKLMAGLGLHRVPVAVGCTEASTPVGRGHRRAIPAEHRQRLDAMWWAIEELLPKFWGSVDPRHGVDLLIQRIEEARPARVSICCLNGVTNVAAAIAKRPAILPQIERVVAAAGALHTEGDVREVVPENRRAEWTVYSDPGAFEAVLRAGVPLTLVPLDATLPGPDREAPLLDRLRAALKQGSPKARLVLAALASDTAGTGLLPHLKRACAAVALAVPSVLETEELPIRFVTTSERGTSGHVAVDLSAGLFAACATKLHRHDFEEEFMAEMTAMLAARSPPKPRAERTAWGARDSPEQPGAGEGAPPRPGASPTATAQPPRHQPPPLALSPSGSKGKITGTETKTPRGALKSARRLGADAPPAPLTVREEMQEGTLVPEHRYEGEDGPAAGTIAAAAAAAAAARSRAPAAASSS